MDSNQTNMIKHENLFLSPFYFRFQVPQGLSLGIGKQSPAIVMTPHAKLDTSLLVKTLSKFRSTTGTELNMT